jgi:hypothetical protein
MDDIGRHPVARIDGTETRATLHARAEAVAVPDFDYLVQLVEGMIDGMTRRPRPAGDTAPKDAR